MKQFADPRRHGGSALILTVVLTSLLAIVGVLFVMTARIERMATSASATSRELDFALDTVMAKISELLVADVPDACDVADDEEYYDFPDANNAWLADLEPYQSGAGYYWRQISDIAGLAPGYTNDVHIRVVGERDPIRNLNAAETTADADGDGVGDARWFQVPGISSGKGQPIYAAVRIIDNGAMLNINTGYRFDSNDPDPCNVNGKSQRQIDVVTVAVGPGSRPGPSNEIALLAARANGRTDAVASNLERYERSVTWGYLESNRLDVYTPFDVSDELELRYRFLLNHEDIDTRVENWGWFKPWNQTIRTPVASGGDELTAWYARVAEPLDPNARYAFRHVVTTYNMDRIITPKPHTYPRMLNVNKDDGDNVDKIWQVIRTVLIETDPGLSPEDAEDRAKQIAVNLRDHMDDDDEVTVASGSSATRQIYGFERPCVYISEVAMRRRTGTDPATLQPRTWYSYAVELHLPYAEDKAPSPESGDWQLRIDNVVKHKDIDGLKIWWSDDEGRFHVILADDPQASLAGSVGFSARPPAGGRQSAQSVQNDSTLKFDEGATIYLERRVGKGDNWIEVDALTVPSGWMTSDGARSVRRDISKYKCIWRLEYPPDTMLSLGNGDNQNRYENNDSIPAVQAHPRNEPLTNIGELGMVLAVDGYVKPQGTTPADVLVDLRNSTYARLFNYLTVIDPADHSHPVSETRIMGRINVNTAPAFVLAQLPWAQYKDDEALEKAQAIVRRRTRGGRPRPYESVGDLMWVDELLELADPNGSNDPGPPAGPDVTPDEADNDFEERDLLFTRISDLVTVRSDVFTAYILVRIGTDGPQKRVVAVLDRSRVNAADDKVRVAVQQFVPDPR